MGRPFILKPKWEELQGVKPGLEESYLRLCQDHCPLPGEQNKGPECPLVQRELSKAREGGDLGRFADLLRAPGPCGHGVDVNVALHAPRDTLPALSGSSKGTLGSWPWTSISHGVLPRE